jgi:hypothetical protein
MAVYDGPQLPKVRLDSAYGGPWRLIVGFGILEIMVSPVRFRVPPLSFMRVCRKTENASDCSERGSSGDDRWLLFTESIDPLGRRHWHHHRLFPKRVADSWACYDSGPVPYMMVVRFVG